MRCARSLLLVASCVSLGSVVLGCSRTAEQADGPPPVAIPGTPLGELVVGEPIRHANLTIFPISSQVARTDDRFVTLDEGLRAGTVTIREVGADGQPVAQEDDPFEQSPDEVALDDDPFGGDPFGQAAPVEQSSHLVQEELEQEPQVFEEIEVALYFAGGAEVNRLVVINTSGRPLYLMPGEVISGGNQDRTIARETVIPPGEQPVPIDVFCVEQGRWSGREVEEAVEILAASEDRETVIRVYGGSAAAVGEEEQVERHEELEEAAERANAGEFVASVGQLSRKARIAVQDEAEQSAVWHEVSALNAKTGNPLETENFAGNYADEEIAALFAPYVEHCRERVLARPQIVGVAVAINGKLEAVDVFESTPLFAKLWPKLLKSYALDAVAVAEEEAAAQTCAVADCIAFLEQAQQAEVGEVELASGLTQTKRKTENLVSFSVTDRADADAVGGAGDGGFGGAIHVNALAH